jgi:hypothetical protein
MSPLEADVDEEVKIDVCIAVFIACCYPSCDVCAVMVEEHMRSFRLVRQGL